MCGVWGEEQSNRLKWSKVIPSVKRFDKAKTISFVYN
ncbi:hypothetical protein G210_1086 [Candida maltosa Xu316]|uniref:Uncharacterized protein n=1 Tax=Candida maltosa (strain Xu316) TaxID=1245528 RepID=M3IVU4_CANMX|nr:hypothetical protein G210_1086 [Candida maltosa Xu316]